MSLVVKARSKPGTRWREVELNPTNLLVAEFEFTPEEFKASNKRLILPALDDDEMYFPMSSLCVLKYGTEPYMTGGSMGVTILVGDAYGGLSTNSFLGATEDFMVALNPDGFSGSPEDFLGKPMYLVTNIPGIIGVDDWEVFDGGSGYAVNDTGTIIGEGDIAHYKVLSVSSGVVTAVEITTGPTEDYIVNGQYLTETASPQAGTGTGLVLRPFTSDITGADGDSDVLGSVVYYIAKVKL